MDFAGHQAADFRALAALLEWQAAMGVDLALGDDAVDRFAETSRETEARRQRAPASMATPVQRPAMTEPAARPAGPGAPARALTGLSAKPPPVLDVALPPEGPGRRLIADDDVPVARPRPQPISGEQAIGDARTLARAAATLEALEAAMRGFEGSALKASARQLVFGDGNPAARVMLIGEAPGRDEDEIGRPFVGKSGQLLDRMLGHIGLDRSSLYIANMIPWRPPGNRTPTPQEIEVCRPFIERQIELVAPDFLVFLGATAATTLTQTQGGILKMRGQWLTTRLGGRTIRSLATLHPAYLLRQPLQKRLAWRDLLTLKAALDGRD